MDAEFGTIKNAIRRRVNQMGAMGPTPENPSCAFSSPAEVVEYLDNHPTFGNVGKDKSDGLGFHLQKRVALEADFMDEFGNYFTL